jgi:hypothetical protein
LFGSAVGITGSLLGFDHPVQAVRPLRRNISMAQTRVLIVGDMDFNRPVTKRFLDLQVPATVLTLPRLPLFLWGYSPSHPLTNPD